MNRFFMFYGNQVIPRTYQLCKIPLRSVNGFQPGRDTKIEWETGTAVHAVNSEFILLLTVL
jgi:hypothetical protein